MSVQEEKVKYCGHCHKQLDEGARYCRYCGAPATAEVGAYIPDFGVTQCIYGPCPTRRRFQCKRCGKRWESFIMGSKPEYCPVCGGKTDEEECVHRPWEYINGFDETKDCTSYPTLMPIVRADWEQKVETTLSWEAAYPNFGRYHVMDKIMSAVPTISICGQHQLGICTDGTVLVAADGRYDAGGLYDFDVVKGVSDWKNIEAVAAGARHALGLCRDGTVVTAGRNEYGQCDVHSWRNIVAIATMDSHSFGLCADGTVVGTTYRDKMYDYHTLRDWRDITAISCGVGHVLGLCSDGTVMAAGLNDHGQSETHGWLTRALEWHNIVAISAGRYYSLGLQRDGRVVALGDNSRGQCNVDHWRDIVAIAAGNDCSYGLHADGTVVAVGVNSCCAEQLHDIVAISADLDAIALQSDGTVVEIRDSRPLFYNVRIPYTGE